MNALILKTKYTYRRFPNTQSTALTFNDCTPAWNIISAPGGYDTTGTNNVDPNDIDTSTLALSIYSQSLGTTTDLVIPPSYLVVSDLGNTGIITYEIPLSDYTWADGIYLITYTFTDSNTGIQYSKSTYVAVLRLLECYLDQKLKALPVCPTCDKTKINQIFEAQMLLEQIQLLLDCNEVTGAQELIDYLNDFCNAKNCSNCN